MTVLVDMAKQVVAAMQPHDLITAPSGDSFRLPVPEQDTTLNIGDVCAIRQTIEHRR
jgi:hypothetical protein